MTFSQKCTIAGRVFLAGVFLWIAVFPAWHWLGYGMAALLLLSAGHLICPGCRRRWNGLRRKRDASGSASRVRGQKTFDESMKEDG